jgi:hypothetical protein
VTSRSGILPMEYHPGTIYREFRLHCDVFRQTSLRWNTPSRCFLGRFHGETRVQIPLGTPNSFWNLQKVSPGLFLHDLSP